MNKRGGTIGTAAPCPTRQMRALPTATGQRQWKGTIPTRGASRNQRGTAADIQQHTAAQTWYEPHRGHSLMGRQCGTPGIASPHPRP